MDRSEAYSHCSNRGIAAPAEPSICRAGQPKLTRARARRRLQCSARIVLLLLAAGFAAQPVCGWGQTAQPSPTPAPGAPATTAPIDTTGQLAAPPSVGPGIPALPAITDTTNPAALDYVIQYPMFGYLGFRKDLADKGIDLIAHYISETSSNTRGIGGTGTAYAQTSRCWGQL